MRHAIESLAEFDSPIKLTGPEQFAMLADLLAEIRVVPTRVAFWLTSATFPC